MTKPARLAIGIGAASLFFLALADAAPTPLSWLCGWIALACGLVSLAYMANHPQVFGKRRGRVSPWRALPVMPYLAAYRIACWVMRTRRKTPAVDQITPALWVGGRIQPSDVPAGAALIVDLTSEFSAPPEVRALPGYRSLPVLDGSTPPDEDEFLALLDELAARRSGILVHCESGRGRAPTAAMLVALRCGLTESVEEAFDLVREGRPCTHLTVVDRLFLERMARRISEGRARTIPAGRWPTSRRVS